MKWTFVNNEFAEEGKDRIRTGDLALQRGYAVFDYFRTIHNKPLFLDDYLQRFFNSAAALFITVPHNPEAVKALIFQLIEKNHIPQSGIRMIATGGYAPDSYTPVEGNFILQQQPLQLPDTATFETGIKIITQEYQRDLPEVKSINYLMGIWLQKKVKEKQAADVLYFQNHIISEFPRANVFIVTPEGRLATPSRNLLQGITRKKVIELAGELLPVEERDVFLPELTHAAEVFMTSTTKRILPVTEVDGIRIGNGTAGPVTRKLYTRFLEMEATQV
ncbi:aminotransferase class IV [Niabella beijingensis]|uniref:aminotransferase class IV n=1 Tax=Niabella beijingensis TaxID=2872700 RepID=UPI001CBD87B3|nr:aminotransferase class IV [Niabella beijingensis]MBZ4188799.1 aminotransferase class IV [Niabella beijingensis]